MPTAGLETAIPAGEQPQSQASESAVIELGILNAVNVIQLTQKVVRILPCWIQSKLVCRKYLRPNRKITSTVQIFPFFSETYYHLRGGYINILLNLHTYIRICIHIHINIQMPVHLHIKIKFLFYSHAVTVTGFLNSNILNLIIENLEMHV